METKPFSIQSPESIAKEYGGNKQKIAQAMQSGLIDPTAGLLAGMFIDRMRSAQVQETAPQTTVAQQVMAPSSGSQPQPQPAAPPGMPAAGGLAALVPGAAPAAPPAAPPMGMAEGGLASLPIPDDMFDASNEYAGGGIVAFAKGGGAASAVVQAVMAMPEFDLLLRSKERGIGGEQVKALENQLLDRLHARGYEMQDLRNAVDQAIETVYAVPRAEQLRQAAPEQYATPTEGLRPQTPPVRGEDRTPVGLESVYAVPRAEQLRQAALEQYATPTEGLRPQTPPVRVEDRAPATAPDNRAEQLFGLNAPPLPGLLTAPNKASAGTVPAAPAAPEAAAQAAPTGANAAPMGLKDFTALYQELLGPRVEPTYLTDLAANMEKQKQQDMWATLAQLGANIAAGQSPHFLTNVGAGLASAIPSAQKSLAERRALEREIAKAQYGEKVAERAERGEAVKFGAEQLSAQDKLAFDREKLEQEAEDKQLTRENTLRVAQTYAAASGIKQERVPDLVAMAYAYQKADPTLTFEQAMSKATASELATKPERSSSEEDTLERLGYGKDGARSGAIRLGAMTEADFSR